MKIVHTSDWHLGARLHEEDRSEEHQAFLAWLTERLAAERPDALIVAGDVFDVKSPSPQAYRLYYEFLARIVRERLCRTVVVTAGNHDNWRLLAAPSRLLAELGVAVVAVAQDGDDVRDEVVVVNDANGLPGLAIAAVPFMFEAELANFGQSEAGDDADRAERVRVGWKRHYRDVIAAARQTAPGVPIVVTGHCTLVGAASSDDESERCRRIGGLEAFDAEPLSAADYVALGHLHVPQAVKGMESKAFYSGSPLKMSFDEARSEKSVNVVTFAKAGELPEVRKLVVPQTVPILTVQGKPEEVMAELAVLANDRVTRRFVRVQLKDFDGEARAHWAEIRALVDGTATQILEENDMRPVAASTSSLKAFAGKGIRQLRPREVAEQKLRGSSRRFDDEQVKEMLAMFDEAAGDLV